MRTTPCKTSGDAATLVIAPLATNKRCGHPTPASRFQHCDPEKEEDESAQFLEYDYDISSLALGFVPFPFTAGYTMDNPVARRFSSSTEERVGLLGAHGAAKAQQYGSVMNAGEIEGLLGQEGDRQEIITTAGFEARLLAKYSLPLMVTYLLQYSFSLVTLFVVGHIGTDELGAVRMPLYEVCI